MPFHWVKAPFILHAAVETVAASSFILSPGSQLPNPSLDSQLVLQSLGGLILSTNLICVVFIARPVFDDTSRLVAASLAFWHLWPMRRAWLRISGGAEVSNKRCHDKSPPRTLGGPVVHLGVHAALVGALVFSALAGGSS